MVSQGTGWDFPPFCRVRCRPCRGPGGRWQGSGTAAHEAGFTGRYGRMGVDGAGPSLPGAWPGGKAGRRRLDRGGPMEKAGGEPDGKPGACWTGRSGRRVRRGGPDGRDRRGGQGARAWRGRRAGRGEKRLLLRRSRGVPRVGGMWARAWPARRVGPGAAVGVAQTGGEGGKREGAAAAGEGGGGDSGTGAGRTGAGRAVPGAGRWVTGLGPGRLPGRKELGAVPARRVPAGEGGHPVGRGWSGGV